MGIYRNFSAADKMILSIESSCDDSSIAITEIASKKVLYHKKISQEAEHSLYGGVVSPILTTSRLLQSQISLGLA